MASDVDQSSTFSTNYKGLSKAQKVVKAARMIFSAYRRDDFADPEGFIAQVGAVLERYDDVVIEAVSNPRNGIQRRSNFPPNVKEIGDACEAEAARRFEIAKAARAPRPQLNRPYVPPANHPGCRANLLVLHEAPQFAAVEALVGSGQVDERDWQRETRGIKIALSVFESLSAGRLTVGRHVAPTDAELRAMYGKREAEAARHE